MGRMIDGLLALSRIQAAALRVEAVDLARLVPQVVDALAPAAAGRSIDWRLGPELGVVQADEALLRQLLKELLANAIKFTEAGTVQISAGCVGGNFRVVIEDSGIGMSEEELDRLFKPFQQVDGSITRRFGGTGLGLAISQRFMSLMHGRISATSRKGEGSSFVVEMPLAEGAGQ